MMIYSEVIKKLLWLTFISCEQGKRRLTGGGMTIKYILASILMGGIMLTLFSSCTLMQVLNPPQGELRLLRVQIPEITEEDLPYDVVVTFEAYGRPTIKKSCFRWLTERGSFSSPPLHCYATEAQDNQPIGSACSRWTAEGPHAQSSPLFCANIERVEYGSPGRFIAKIQTRNVATYYNWLECYVEYLIDGEVKQSNKIRTAIAVSE
jgi:hypothetical protein